MTRPTPVKRPARLPGLPAVNTADAGMRQWMRVVAEHLETRAGSRGDPKERAVTVRELEAANMASTYLALDTTPGPGEVRLDLGGGHSATVHVDRFVESIRNLPLFRDLVKRLDDPSRFDHLPGEVRRILLNDIALEARKRGAEIQAYSKVVEDRFSSLALKVEEVTAAVADAAAGVRQVSYAVADGDSAMAGQVTQLVASLGNYYQDGAPGRAMLEQDMFAQADRIRGLQAQYTLKVQAGNSIAGFGLAATENAAGNATSAFIVAANKFAIVDPNTYTGGLTSTPNMAHIPFGVDGHGIYLNQNVYIKGNVRIDTGGKTLNQGLRGSVDVYRSGVWSDAVARDAVWVTLGYSGASPNNNHLVIGDTVTFTSGMTSDVRMWRGTAWINPGMVLNGNMLVNGSVAAHKIDTRGLDIKDAQGRVIFSSGTGLTANQISGLGTLATANAVNIGHAGQYSQVMIDGELVLTHDFVTRKSPINPQNITTFISGAAIGEAQIRHAAIETLHVAGEAVTVMDADVNSYHINVNGNTQVQLGVIALWMPMQPPRGRVALWGSASLMAWGNNDCNLQIRKGSTNGQVIGQQSTSFMNGYRGGAHVQAVDTLPQAGWNSYFLMANLHGGSDWIRFAHSFMGQGAKR